MTIIVDINHCQKLLKYRYLLFINLIIM